MAKKLTEQNQDSIRSERAYRSEKSRIESNERYSKNRTRRRIIEGIGKIATGRGHEGGRIIRDAVDKRIQDNTRNSVEHGVNETIHAIEQRRYGGSAAGSGIHDTTERMDKQRMDSSRHLPDKREGSNGMTVDQLSKLNDLKETNPQEYKKEMQRIFGVGTSERQTGEPVNKITNEKHGLKL